MLRLPGLFMGGFAGDDKYLSTGLRKLSCFFFLAHVFDGKSTRGLPDVVSTRHPDDVTRHFFM